MSTAPEILHDAYTSVRQPPANLAAEDKAVFSKEYERAIPATYLKELRGHIVTYDGVLLDRWNVHPESIRNGPLREALKYRYWAKTLIKGKKKSLGKGPYLIIHNYYWKGYFHWMSEALTRLYAVRHLLSEYTLLLPRPAGDFHKKTLQAFPIGKVEYLEEGQYAKPPLLTLATYTAPPGNYNHEYIRGVAEMIRGHFTKNLRLRPIKLYISRKNAPKRRVANESELVPILESFGYTSVCMEDHSYEEQVAFSAAATRMVSLHGAGLTNMMFMPAGSKVLELRQSGELANHCYFSLCSEFDHQYYYLVSPTVNNDTSHHSADIIVDVGQFKKALESMG